MQKLIRITTVPGSLLVLLRKQLEFMSNHFHVIAISSKGPTLDKVAVQTGVEIAAVDMTRKMTPIKDIAALWQLYKKIKQENPLIVHTHTPKAGLLGMIAAYMANVPIRLHTVAGMPLLEEKGMKRKVLDQIEKLTYYFSTRVYPNSFNMMNIILENNYCDSSKLKVIGNGSSSGIDVNYFNPSVFSIEDNEKFKKSLGIETNELVYLFIGRMVKDKGINELVKAFSKISQKRKELKLVLLGLFEDNLDPLDKNTEKEIKTNPNILWVSYKQDVRPYLAISDVFVFPSYREGFPNVVMQAGAMEKPCIVTDINGCNEIIQDNINGLIIPPKDTKALQKAMVRLMDDTSLRNKMAGFCRKMIVERYEQQYLLNEILKEYQLQINQIPVTALS